MPGIKFPNLAVKLKERSMKMLPKFLLVVSRSGLNRCSIRIVWKVNKTKYYVSRNRLIINLRGRITEDNFLKEETLPMLLICCIGHAFISAFQICVWLFMSDPEDPPRGGPMRHFPFSHAAKFECRCDVSDRWQTHEMTDDTSPLLTCVQLFMLAMCHSSPAVI